MNDLKNDMEESGATNSLTITNVSNEESKSVDSATTNNTVDGTTNTVNDDLKENKEIKEISEEEKENQLRDEVNSLNLKNLDVPLMYEMMSIPTYSGYEYRMATWLILWARKHNIDYSMDDYGNIYFIKGKPKEYEFYPCVTAHIDTVQDKAKPYILTGAELDLRTRKNTKGQYEVYIDGMGTGSDDKNAILIALHMFDKFDVLKGAFFLEEEVGCKGSKNMDESFFEDVSYVIGFDSPELNRAAWKLLGNIKMFTANFYKTHMKPICDKYGMTKFYSESVTDEAYITERTGLVTMNFGNGGYNAHANNEYFIVEEVDHALSMGIELVETIPTNIKHLVRKIVWQKDSKTNNLVKTLVEIDPEDKEYLENLGDKGRYTSYTNRHSTNNYYTNYNSNNKNNNNENVEIKKDSTTYSEESVKYIVEVYEDYIKQISSEVANQCKDLNIDFEKNFAPIFSKEITF